MMLTSASASRRTHLTHIDTSMLRRLVTVGLSASLAALGSVVVATDEYSFSSVSLAGSAAGQVTHNAYERSGDIDQVQRAELGKSHIQHKIRAGEVQVRGVNLGSWLVAEKWMTNTADFWQNAPEDVAGGGEYQVMAHGDDQQTRRSRFDNHHDTFVTEMDIAAIAKAGLNTVRVPVGYWIVGEDPFDYSGEEEWKMYPNGTVKYLDRLIKTWALKHNVAVMISLHGAKGSQNGADHSAPTVSGETYWSDFPENVNNTINVARSLAERYKHDAAFLGMGLLNEPNGKTNEDVLNQYYKDAYAAVRATGTDCVLTVMPMLSKQDATNLNGFMEAPEYTNVWVEWHPYFIWGYDKVSASDLINKSIATDFATKVATWNSRKNANKLFFGEWSLANTGQFQDPDSDDYKNWARAQIKVMDQAQGGWTYWSWRLYEDDRDGAFNAWSMRNVMAKEALAKILLRQDATQA